MNEYVYSACLHGFEARQQKGPIDERAFCFVGSQQKTRKQQAAYGF
ncbi:hypothetical protein [Paraburkholderia caffeinilytica]